MIIFDLKCIHDHGFEGWFKNIEEYECQVKDGMLTCPICDSGNVHKVPSAKIQASNLNHNLNHSDAKQALVRAFSANEAGSSYSSEITDTREAWLKKIGEYVEKHFDDVGTKFAEEAKRIHIGQSEVRNIKGTATSSEIMELNEEGITAISLPQIVDKKKLN